ncbi:hypothetical protein [Endozoicomonas sp. ALB115]|uniref:hypothetical protein n=1 Tax=Endozoicomonas sp. ALB115 TaxID=3403074 RepID=UPI003BB70A50
MSKIRQKIINITGLNGDPVILLSFFWYIFNVLVSVNYVLPIDAKAESYGGFESIEAYMAYAFLFTFVPHILCMEKGVHDFFGVKFLNDAFILIPAFTLHCSLSAVVL